MTDFARTLETALSSFSAFMWGPALIVLLVGGGLFLAFYSGFRPYLHFKHAFDIVRGKFDKEAEGVCSCLSYSSFSVPAP